MKISPSMLHQTVWYTPRGNKHKYQSFTLKSMARWQTSNVVCNKPGLHNNFPEHASIKSYQEQTHKKEKCVHGS